MASTFSSKAEPTTYTFGHSQTVTASHASRTVHNSAAFLLPHLTPNMSLLDIGCGPGTITTGFSPYLPNGRIIGADYSSTVIVEATALAKSQDLSNVSFQVADIFALPFGDNTFDVIYAHQTFPHLPHPVDALKELHRVVKTGGMVATRDGIAWHWHPSLPGLELFATALGRMFAHSGASFEPPGKRMHVLAREAGFERSKMTVGMGGTVYSSDEERRWWAKVQGQRLVDDQYYRAKAIEAGTSEEEIKLMLRDLEIWKEDPDGWYGLAQAENIYRK
jgi:SAM-dependent methyltransferase